MKEINRLAASLLGLMVLSFSCAFGQYGELQIPKNTAGHREAVQGKSSERTVPGGNGGPIILAPPTNDNCASATTLTVNANCISGTTDQATQQGGEYLCISPGGGISPETVWYRFTATATTMVLGFVQTNTTNCATVVAAYGPFGAGAGCLPGAGNQILCQNMALIDPGFHPQLTGLTVGQQYLVQVQGNSCGGGNDRFSNYCISINTLATNSSASAPSMISSCGVAFNGTTGGGYFGNGTSVGNNNLDNNLATTLPFPAETGDDVSFVVNNISWFSFCNGNAVSCNWALNVSSITNCLLPSINAGVQSAVFTGSPAALTNIASSPSRIAPGGSWASGTFTLTAGQCAYIMTDGFAGDECDYNLTLTNVSCPCALLPIEMAFLTGAAFPEFIELNWKMTGEEDVQDYRIEHSMDGTQFSFLDVVDALAPQADGNDYRYRHISAAEGWNYYRISAKDINGREHLMNTVSVFQGRNSSPLQRHFWEEDILKVIYNADQSKRLSLSIQDVSGRILYKGAYDASSGSNTLALDLSGLSKGIYMLNIQDGQQQVTSKFIRN